MAHPRRFRFGVQRPAPAGQDWVSTARRVEELGYSTLFLPDHFGDQLAPMPAMAAAATATTDLRVGALVHDVDYKHPVVLAKELATIDVMSGGRVEAGLGAGWMNSDYEQSGIPKDRDGVRIARMVEAVEVCRGLWSDGAFSYEGAHYRISGLDGLPKPVQRPGPPVLIGGGGPKVLRLAGQHADIVGVNPSLPSGVVDAGAVLDTAPKRVDEKVAWVREGAGERFDDLELNILVFACMVTDDREGAAESLAGLFGVSPTEVLESPYAWIGSVEEIADDLRAARERWGTSYFVVQGDALETAAPIVATLAGT